LPGTETLRALHDAGCAVLATVTTPGEARTAVDAGVDALCVQGPEAGGHRATFHVGDLPDTTSLPDLLDEITGWCPIPVIAAGGLTDGRRITGALAHGAVAVQLGTAFLRTPESGAQPAH